MSIFIKAGLWSEKIKGLKGEFNLTQYVTQLINNIIPPPTPTVQTITGAQVNNADPENPIIKDYRDGKYKEVYGLLSQNGTSQLNAIAGLERYPSNFLNNTVQNSKVTDGVYDIVYQGPDANQFTANKTLIFIGSNFSDLGGDAPQVDIEIVDSSTLRVRSYLLTAGGPVLSDGVINNLPIHIRVYA
jgi:hypothetical protein